MIRSQLKIFNCIIVTLEVNFGVFSVCVILADHVASWLSSAGIHTLYIIVHLILSPGGHHSWYHGMFIKYHLHIVYYT